MKTEKQYLDDYIKKASAKKDINWADYHKEAEYEFKDKKGNVLWYKRKYRHKDGKKKTLLSGTYEGKKWKSGLDKDIEKPLYRLPEFLASKDKTRFVCEGEKDTDNLRTFGHTAVCAPFGARHWNEEWSQFFIAREVILVPDNDEAGQAFEQKIGKNLIKVTKVHVVKIPKKYKDFSEWQAVKGNNEEAFKKLRFEKWKPKSDLTLQDSKKKKQRRTGKEKIVYTTETLVPRLIHLVKSEKGQVLYLLLSERGKLEIIEYLESYSEDEQGDLILIRRIPKQDLPIKYVDKSILKIKQKDLNFKELFDEVVKFIKSYVELPLEEQYLLLAVWVFHTYLIEKNDTTPILYFYGVKITGKTRAGEVLEEIAYKCERLTTPTEATMFRAAEYFKTALIIDELKLWGKDSNEAIATLLKSRYKRGIKVSRCNMLKKGENMIEYFDVFGPTVICSTESVPDALESRCILFLMQKNINPVVEKKINKEWTAELRKKLTLFRVKYFDIELPEAETIARRRLQEILGPLQQIQGLIKPDDTTTLKEIAKALEEDIKEEEASSLDAEIVENIKYYHKIEEDKYFLTTELTDRINEDKTDKEKLKTRMIALRVKRIGFKRHRTPGGHRGFKTNKELLEKLLRQFNIEEGP